MSETSVIIEPYGIGHAVALVRDNLLVDLMIDPKKQTNQLLIGSIVAAKIDRFVKGVNGTFVSLPYGKEGFIRGFEHCTDINKIVIGSIATHTESHKAHVVSTNFVIKQRFTIVTFSKPGINFSRKIKGGFVKERISNEISKITQDIPGDSGIIIRSEAENAAPGEILNELIKQIEILKTLNCDGLTEPKILLQSPLARELMLRDLPKKDVKNIIDEESAFDRFGLWEQIYELADTRVNLSNGGFLLIEPTAALISIDVNTGSDVSKYAPLNTNLLAARELARQLLLRGLGGKITIDFAPLLKIDRRKIEFELKRAFKNDRIQTSIIGWTKLGNLEIQRKRERLPLNLGSSLGINF